MFSERAVARQIPAQTLLDDPFCQVLFLTGSANHGSLCNPYSRDKGRLNRFEQKKDSLPTGVAPAALSPLEGHASLVRREAELPRMPSPDSATDECTLSLATASSPGFVIRSMVLGGRKNTKTVGSPVTCLRCVSLEVVHESGALVLMVY